jgi:hypothetical protein
MNLLPCPAQFVQPFRQDAKEAPDLSPREPIVFPEFYGSGQTVQIKHRLATTPNRVDVRRPMIVRIDRDPQPVKPENRWHNFMLA